MRPQDRGFHETLVLKGGGIGQPSDPRGGESYFDPVLQHNGRQVKTKGYCSDVFTDAACRFIETERDKPFFAYLPFNAPHAPLQVPDADYEPYKQMNLALSEFPKSGFPVQGRYEPDVTARIYGMVTNLDRNVGRLLAKLDALKLAERTIVIFMTDNGPQQPRYNAGLHGRKGSVYDGGIRVPCFIRWPDAVPAGRQQAAVAAHIDIVPTLLDACGVEKPPTVKLDGVSLLPLLKGERADLPERTLFFQWHRGDRPELYRACAVRTARWKLVQPSGAGAAALPSKLRFELYDMPLDPYEQHDFAGEHPGVVELLRNSYEAWFKDVSSHGYPPARIFLGTPHENPTVLTRQDWRGPAAAWEADSLGHWEVRVAEAGRYEVRVHFNNAAGGNAHFSLNNVALDQAVPKGKTECRFRPAMLEKGDGRLEAWLANGRSKQGVRYVEVARLE
jgi:arylsulfatase A-like enzyme